MQNFLVIISIVLAALVVINRLLRLWRRSAAGTGCACDCGGCSSGSAPPACRTTAKPRDTGA
ncbi:MAG: hypothetical protein BWK76_20000 [Desulfobulbaceae bacterium A2]|nr:MAG: hypothetical protein BWK76_20000 [Desulfobulbaceae bacterium A2]